MAFDGEAFVDRFNTVWNGHDVAGILAMMTADVVLEASFGKDPWGTRVVGKPAVRPAERIEALDDVRLVIANGRVVLNRLGAASR